MPDTHEAVARVILREVPLARLGSFVNKLNVANVGNADSGHGCGLGCSSTGVDSRGLSSLTEVQLRSAVADKPGLRKALNTQIAATADELK